jgi:hypothetical protein
MSNLQNEVVVQLNLGLEPVELSPEMQKKSEVSYAYGKASFRGKPVHYAGDLSILDKHFVAIGLSEHAENPTRPISPVEHARRVEALTCAKRAAASLATHGEACLVIGGTRRGDMEVIRPHIEHGGRVLVLLPMGLSEYGKRFITDEVKQFVANGSLILVSQFAPSRAWSLETAKERNMFLAKVAWSLYVADASGEKGIWGLAECFRSMNKVIRINKLGKGSRMELYGLVGALGARELKEAVGDADVYAILTHK